MTDWQNTIDHHPNARRLLLWNIQDYRRMLREGRYAIDCQREIKRTQRELAALRACR